MPTIEKSEEHIEQEIMEFLTFHGASLDKIISEGYFDANRGIYRQRKSHFVAPGIADIVGVIPGGRYFAIEVKRPSEMRFFDKPIQELIQKQFEAIQKGLSHATIKKYTHAVSQRGFLDEKILCGGIAFFASSIDEVVEKFAEFGVMIK